MKSLLKAVTMFSVLVFSTPLKAELCVVDIQCEPIIKTYRNIIDIQSGNEYCQELSDGVVGRVALSVNYIQNGHQFKREKYSWEVIPQGVPNCRQMVESIEEILQNSQRDCQTMVAEYIDFFGYCEDKAL